MERPKKNEYSVSHQKYVDLVGAGDFIALLDQNTEVTISFFQSITKEKEDYRYADGKWTVKEVLMHIIDTERGLSYRAIVAARNDAETILYSMDEELYANHIDVTSISMSNLIDEFKVVRAAFRCIFSNNRKGKFDFLANGIGYKVSARAMGYVAIGHIIHHCAVVRDRYF